MRTKLTSEQMGCLYQLLAMVLEHEHLMNEHEQLMQAVLTETFQRVYKAMVLVKQHYIIVLKPTELMALRSWFSRKDVEVYQEAVIRKLLGGI